VHFLYSKNNKNKYECQNRYGYMSELVKVVVMNGMG